MIKHVLLVVNPRAESHTDVESWLPTLIETLNSRADCVVSVCYTTASTTTQTLIELLEPPLDLVIAAGGDGTLRFALSALARQKADIPLAIMPTGTGNVLARNLGIVPQDFLGDPMESAIENIVNGVVHPIDLGRMNGFYFSGIAGAGPLAEAFASPRREQKTNLKMFAYAASMFETIAHSPVMFRIATPDTTFRVKASGVFVGNVHDLGFGREPRLEDLTDRKLSLIVLSPRDFSDYVNMGFRFLTGESKERLPIYITEIEEAIIDVSDASARRSSFQEMVRHILESVGKGVGGEHESPSECAIPAMIDGELYGTTPMHVQVAPQAVKVVVPRGSALLDGAGSWLESESKSDTISERDEVKK